MRAVEALADDGVVGGLHDGGQVQAGLGRPARLRHVPEDQHHAGDGAVLAPDRGGGVVDRASRVPSLATRTVWFASPTTWPSRSTLATGFSTGRRVSSLTMRKTSLQRPPRRLLRRPAGQRLGHRVEEGRRRPRASVTITASPMLARVTCSCSRCVAAIRLRRAASAAWRAASSCEQAAGVLLGPLPLGQVPGDLGEAAQDARLVPQGRDDDVGPERRAVLADPPALVLEPARPPRRPPVPASGQPALDGLLRVEAGEVLADDLVGLVALDPLGPGVPGGDVALRVEHEDGVVLDALDQQPEPLLAQPRASPRPACGPSGRG